MKRWLVLCLLAWSCDGAQFPRQTPEDLRAARVLPSDVAIYEAVVAAYAANGEILGAPPPPPNDRRALSLSEVAERSARARIRLREETNVRDEIDAPAPDRWRTLSGERVADLAVPEDVVRDFARRNQRAASLRDYEPTHLKVERTRDQIGSPSSSILSLTLPGYSSDGEAAVVEVSVSTSGLSGGGELLFLRKIEGVWRVIARQQTWIS